MTATDASGRLVTDLTQDEFRVRDDGEDVEITTYSTDAQPLAVTLLLDMSEDNVEDVLRIRNAARLFLEAVQPGDLVRIGSFGTEIAISPFASDDRARLQRVLAEELWPGGPAPLWAALHDAIRVVPPGADRPVVLCLTRGAASGVGAASGATFETVLQQAVEAPVMVYVIGMEGTGLESRVEELAARTGGGHFVVPRTADLGRTFARVAEELRHQYLLGFVPAERDGRFHRLEVQVTRPGVVARARDGYQAGGGDVRR